MEHWNDQCAQACSENERDKRLLLAEQILSDLATGFWVSVLDDNDDPCLKDNMGQRIKNYWRKWDSPPTTKLTDPAAKPKETL